MYRVDVRLVRFPVRHAIRERGPRPQQEPCICFRVAGGLPHEDASHLSVRVGTDMDFPDPWRQWRTTGEQSGENDS
jgi:hypothetical protein